MNVNSNSKLHCATLIIGLMSLPAAIAGTIAKNQTESVQHIGLSDAALSANRDLEAAFDNVLASTFPLLDPAIARMAKSDNAYLMYSLDPYETITVRGDSVSGVTRSGHVYAVKTEMDVGMANVTFSRDSQELFRFQLTTNFEHGSMKLHAGLENISDPARNVTWGVSDANFSVKGNRVATLTVNYNGQTVSENVWRGKAQFENINELAVMMSSLSRTSPGFASDLDNFYFLPANDIRLSQMGWLMLAKLNASGEGKQILGGAPAPMNFGGYPGTIDSDEAYWCGVGTIGADVVFTLGGSFLYAMVCGDLASQS